jgi:hypothetical protein
LHDLRRIEPPAVRAWLASLESQQPLGPGAFPSPPRYPCTARPHVLGVIYDSAARLAVALTPVPATPVSMEVGERLHLMASRAALHCVIVHLFDIKINSGGGFEEPNYFGERDYAGTRLRVLDMYGASARTVNTKRIHTTSPMKIGGEYASAYVTA